MLEGNPIPTHFLELWWSYGGAMVMAKTPFQRIFLELWWSYAELWWSYGYGQNPIPTQFSLQFTRNFCSLPVVYLCSPKPHSNAIFFAVYPQLLQFTRSLPW